MFRRSILNEDVGGEDAGARRQRALDEWKKPATEASYGYAAKENILHILWEQHQWLEK